jgi:predicted ATPase
MLDRIKIENYKSLKDVEFSCKRVNIFMGEPNSGKSNLIECLSFFSPGVFENIAQIIRFKTTADLFFDNNIKNPINIEAGNYSLNIKYNGENYVGLYRQDNDIFSKVIFNKTGLQNYFIFDSPFRVFKFISFSANDKPTSGSLEPPFGANLVSSIFSNRELKRLIADILRQNSLKLQIKPSSMEMEIIKHLDEDIISSYPFHCISETFQRLFFHLAAIETCSNSILIFEEPDFVPYPYHHKVLAERIAFSTSNQFFISTHNPFLVNALFNILPNNEIQLFNIASFESQSIITEAKLSDLPFQLTFSSN